MPNISMPNIDISYIVIFFLSFGCLFSLFFYLTDKDRIKERNLDRLKIYEPTDDGNNKKNDEEDWIFKLYNKYYNEKFIQANLKITFGEFRTYFYSISIVSLAIVTLVLFAVGGVLSLAIAAVIVAILWKGPDIYIENKRVSRKRALDVQKSDILAIMSSCSSSQMPLDKTFKTLSERLKAPANEIFLEAYSLMKVGNPAEDVLKHLKKVFDSNDFNFLLSSYEVWLENQGSLQETYKIVSMSIRDKEEIDLHMAGFVSKAKTTIIVLICISIFFVGLSLVMINDIFMEFARSGIGQAAIVVSIGIIGWGVLQINKIKNGVKY